jgi:hypothetical protein
MCMLDFREGGEFIHGAFEIGRRRFGRNVAVLD